MQQFEDSTQYEIQTINEELLTLNAQRHTHNNKEVLDTITEQYLQDEAAFRASTSNALHSLSTGLSEVSAQAHSHHNLATLNGITDSHVSRWEEAYTAAMNLNERVGVNEGVFERFKIDLEIRDIRINSSYFAAAGFKKHIVFREVWGDDHEIVIRLCGKSAGY